MPLSFASNYFLWLALYFFRRQLVRAALCGISHTAGPYFSRCSGLRAPDVA